MAGGYSGGQVGSSAREGLEQGTSLLRVRPTTCCNRLHPLHRQARIQSRVPPTHTFHCFPEGSLSSRRRSILPVLLPLLLAPSLDRVSYKSPNSSVWWRVPKLPMASRRRAHSHPAKLCLWHVAGTRMALTAPHILGNAALALKAHRCSPPRRQAPPR